MQDVEKAALKIKQDLIIQVQQYKTLCKEAGLESNPQFMNLIKLVKNDIEKSIEDMSNNRYFSQRMLNDLRYYYGRTLNNSNSVNEIEKLENFIKTMEIDFSSETVNEYLNKTKCEIDRLYVLYTKNHVLSKDDIVELLSHLDFYLCVKDTKTLYNKLVVPIHGLVSHNENVVNGCFDDIKNVLNKHNNTDNNDFLKGFMKSFERK